MIMNKDVAWVYGYSDREDYLRGLAEDNDLSYEEVLTVASMLGPTEDFDGLLSFFNVVYF